MDLLLHRILLAGLMFKVFDDTIVEGCFTLPHLALRKNKMNEKSLLMRSEGWEVPSQSGAVDIN